ncbi:hypothetical protein F0310_02845 [Borrelia sp. A-FGy1]|uniref:hypothetical protein n=1 Tax=Borrelia sp. A-FGy1 TaxID=2608247 RepID=UPI0015F7670E|nr:hypothetical protein [Borrelia sp. A-FGy1]QMU99340.1 hypothetical protein F0310_02845 [Borrelia sp. A-FGy1]
MFNLKRFSKFLNMDFLYNKRLYFYYFIAIFGTITLILFLSFYYDFSLIDSHIIDGIIFLFFVLSYITSIYI